MQANALVTEDINGAMTWYFPLVANVCVVGLDRTLATSFSQVMEDEFEDSAAGPL